MDSEYMVLADTEDMVLVDTEDVVLVGTEDMAMVDTEHLWHSENAESTMEGHDRYRGEVCRQMKPPQRNREKF